MIFSLYNTNTSVFKMYRNCYNSLCALRKSDEVWFFGFVWGFFALFFERFLASLLNSNRSFQLDSYFFSWNSLELTDVIQTGRHVLSANIRQDVIQGICSLYRFFFFFSCPRKCSSFHFLFLLAHGNVPVHVCFTHYLEICVRFSTLLSSY